jgi:hypothetical protein
MQRFFLDMRPIEPPKGAADAKKPPNVEKIQAELLIVLGRHAIPPEAIPAGHEGLVVYAYDTAFEFIEVLNKFLRGEQGAAALVPLEHFLVMKPFDHTRAKVFFQYNVAIVPEHNQTPSFVIPFEEIAREILLFAVSVYESILEMYPPLESDLETLGTTIEETKTAVEQYLGIENLLSLPVEEETKKD